MQRKAVYKRVHFCEVCGFPFIAARATAKTCSGKCRTRKSRAGRKTRGLSSRVTMQQLEMLLVSHGGQMSLL